MKIEILFPEFCNLFGDLSNMRYLEKCLPEAAFLSTSLSEEPLFLHEKPDLIYLGPMTERTQEKVIEKLLPMRDRLRELMDDGTPFLFTGNAMEVLGSYIENEDGSRIAGLDLLPLSAKRDMLHRHNSTFLGTFQGKPVMGFKSQFTMAFPGPNAQGLFPVTKGVGLNRKCPYEGLRIHNFFGTYLLGPVLILNPDFTRSLLAAMGAPGVPLAFEQDMKAAYEKRLRDFQEKG